MSISHPIKFSEDEPSKWCTIKYKIIWWIKDIIPWSLRDWYYTHIRSIFAPQHSRLRKAIPRTWQDISHLIEIVNFEFIKSFYEDEYTDGFVDWNHDQIHKDFAQWLESAYAYITKERPELEAQMWASYPDYKMDNWWEEYKTRKGNNEDLYGEVNRLEALIREKDTEVLINLIKNRDFFWT